MDFALNDTLRADILQHAERQAPRECCGLIVKRASDGWLLYWPCDNVHPDAGGDRFRVSSRDYVMAEELGEVLAVVHSHPNASANPSMADRVGCERSGLPWLIAGWPSGVIKLVEPSGFVAPYVEREFCHGILDCYTLIQDWYWRELGLELPDFEREDGWWERGEDLYMAGFEQAGFVKVGGLPQRHDVLLMQVRSIKANHGAIALGDGNILHHLHSRPSCKDVYGGYWERHTLVHLRHISRVTPAEAFGVAMQAAA